MRCGLNSRVAKKKEVFCISLVDRKVVLYNSGNQAFYILNETATRIWQLIDRRRRVKDIVEIMSREYLVDKKKLFCDILSQIMKFKKEQLIEVKG